MEQRQTVQGDDVYVDDTPALVEAIMEQLPHSPPVEPGRVEDEDEHRLRIRKSLIDDPKYDPNGLERVLGVSDLVSINYLTRGVEAARAVCRIHVTGPNDWYGTGFLAGPQLLVTNHHVIRSPDDAARAQADFDHEHDADGVLRQMVSFNLNPSDVFFTDERLDITLVGVAPFSDREGVPLSRFGWLPLLPLSGKGVRNEWVTIAQHPGGKPKQMTIRKHRIIELEPDEQRGIDPERFIHYRSDTEPGSSGAPVLNDQWQVVAVHHKAVPHPDTDLSTLAEEGKQAVWIANEGVRVSAICARLEQLRFSSEHAARAVDRLERAIGIPTKRALPTSRTLRQAEEADRAPHDVDQWQRWQDNLTLGYDPDFLSVHIDLTDILGSKADEAAPLDAGGIFLDYLHFSSVIHAERRFPILTAVNIRGDLLKHPGDRSGSWRPDIRLTGVSQPAGNFYERKLGNDPVNFSRGHLVRRLDPCWGETVEIAQIADRHTFHYTNAAPQVQGFNAGDWLDIEDYVLEQTQTKERRVTIITGPVFHEHDPIYGEDREDGPWLVPETYWKVAVMETENGGIAATAFLQGQTKFLEALFEAKVFGSLRQNTLGELQSDNLQTTLKTIETETGLDFSNLKDHERFDALERTRFLFSLEDVRL